MQPFMALPYVYQADNAGDLLRWWAYLEVVPFVLASCNINCCHLSSLFRSAQAYIS